MTYAISIQYYSTTLAATTKAASPSAADTSKTLTDNYYSVKNLPNPNDAPGSFCMNDGVKRSKKAVLKCESGGKVYLSAYFCTDDVCANDKCEKTSN